MKSWHTVSDKVCTCLLYAVYFYSFPFCRTPQKLPGFLLHLKDLFKEICAELLDSEPDLFSFVLGISVKSSRIVWDWWCVVFNESKEITHDIVSERNVWLERWDLERFEIVVIIKHYKQKLKL